MTKPLLRVLGWAAVSTKDQAEDDKYSIPGQIEAIRDFCEKQKATGQFSDVVLVDTIVIRGHSRKYRTLDKLITGIKNPAIKDEMLRFTEHLSNSTFDVLACRDANRFARKASLLYEIAGMVIEDCKARIYSFGDGWGWVDNRNYGGWLAIKGYETENQGRWLAESMQQAKISLVERGLPHGVGLCWAYKRVRDEVTGKVVKLVPDPGKRYIIEKAAELFIHDKTGFRFIEQRLWDDYQIGREGKPFPRYFFYHLFWNPTLHGNKAMNHKNPHRPKGQTVAPWLFDPTVPAPPDVLIRYGVVEPALPQPMLSLLQQELTRRYEIGSQYRSGNTHKFTGLIVCGHCGRNMVYNQSAGRARWLCRSKVNARQEPRCEKVHGLKEQVVEAWLTQRIRERIEQGAGTLFAAEEPQATADQAAVLRQEIARVDGEADRLVMQLRKAPVELVETYSRQLNDLAAELRGLKRALQEAELEVQQRRQEEEASALTELKSYDDIEAFWEKDENTINQLLRRAMGKRRIVIADRRIIGTRLAP